MYEFALMFGFCLMYTRTWLDKVSYKKFKSIFYIHKATCASVRLKQMLAEKGPKTLVRYIYFMDDELPSLMTKRQQIIVPNVTNFASLIRWF